MARSRKNKRHGKRRATKKRGHPAKAHLENVDELSRLANKISQASQGSRSAAFLPPDQLAAAELARTADLSNKVQLQQLQQQGIQQELASRKPKRGGGSSSDVRSPTSTEVRSPTSTSTEVRSPTSTSTEVRSPTSTSTEVRSPTSTSTDAYTQGNITVTGGAGAGATTIYIGCLPEQLHERADKESNKERSRGSAKRIQRMIQQTGAPRVPSVISDFAKLTSAPRPDALMPEIMKATSSARPEPLMPKIMKATSSARPKPLMPEIMKATSASRPTMPFKQTTRKRRK